MPDKKTLTKAELGKIIDQFDEEELKKLGYAAILQYGGGSDESFIRANKEGLAAFALELLKAARDLDTALAEIDARDLPINLSEDWFDQESDTLIGYIQPIREKPLGTLPDKLPETIADRLIPVGCGLVMLILLSSILIGLVTIFNWIF